jgi:hypothetical protein
VHTNHRRKNIFRAKHHNGCGCWMRLIRLKPFRRQKSRDRRASEREALAHERWDDLPRRYPNTLYWELW